MAVDSMYRDAPAGRFSLQLWRQHVLANLPMYSILVPLYLDLARSRVSSRCEETLIDMKRVDQYSSACLDVARTSTIPNSLRVVATTVPLLCYVSGVLMSTIDLSQMTLKAVQFMFARTMVESVHVPSRVKRRCSLHSEGARAVQRSAPSATLRFDAETTGAIAQCIQ